MDRLLTGDRPHVERIAVAVAVLGNALERRGCEVTVVGGSALELHAPGIYATRDIDVVIEGSVEEGIAETRVAAGQLATRNPQLGTRF